MTATPKLPANHALDQFQKYLITHNKSPNTICVYRYGVEQFYHLYPQLTPRNLQLYKVYLLEHYRPQTVNLRIRALNCYMEYRQTAFTPISMIKIQQKTYLDKNWKNGSPSAIEAPVSCSSTVSILPSPLPAYGPSSKSLQPDMAWTPKLCILTVSATVLPKTS